jgi:hypothetical protein
MCGYMSILTTNVLDLINITEPEIIVNEDNLLSLLESFTENVMAPH